MTTSSTDVRSFVWQWIRGDADDAAFEPWLYANFDAVRVEFGAELAQELIELDFRPAGSVANGYFRLALVPRLAPSCHCPCPVMRDRQRLLAYGFLDDAVQRIYEELGQRTPWIGLRRCRTCGQCWLSGCDTCDYDWYFERLDPDVATRQILGAGEWPTTFDGWEHLWPFGAPTKQVVPPSAFRVGVFERLPEGLQSVLPPNLPPTNVR